MREKVVTSALVSSCFSFTLFYFAPAQVYLTNLQEYSHGFLRLSLFFVGLSLFSTILLSALLSCVGPGIHEKLVSLVFATCILLWVQGNFIIWDYGVFDGRSIQWRANTLNAVVDGTIWASVLLLAVALAPRFQKFVRQGSIAILLIFTISTLFLLTKMPASKLVDEKRPLLKSFFQFSKEKNVILIVADSFQGDVFQEIIDEDAALRKSFDGFTFYRNALSGYPRTCSSIPLILTGRYFDHTIPAEDFLNKYTTESLPAILSENGYQVHLAAARTFCGEANLFPQWACMDQISGSPWQEPAIILDIALFRYLPSYLKRKVYNDQAWFVRNIGVDKSENPLPVGPHRNTLAFINAAVRQADALADQPTFKLIHLYFPHPAYCIDENLRFGSFPETRENFKGQSAGTLKLINIFMDKLKELDIYDCSLIVIVADHGTHDGWNLYYENQGKAPLPKKRPKPWLKKMKGEAVPLVLVKGFREEGDLKISDTPVSLADVSKTILSELKLKNEFAGRSMFAGPDASPRIRRFLLHDNWFSLKYAGPLTEYFVAGPPWVDESWYSTQKSYTADGIQTVGIKKYRIGETIRYAMTDSKTSLALPITEPHSDLKLYVSFTPHLAARPAGKQSLAIDLNGESLAQFAASVDEQNTQSVVIPHKAVSGSVAELEFELPEWPSVAEKPEKSTGAENVALITITLQRATATDQLTKEAN